MFKKIGFWIYDFYRFFFDLKVNPLAHSKPLHAIHSDVLSVGHVDCHFYYLGRTNNFFGIGSVAAHLLVVGGFFITALTFMDAEKNGHLWVKRDKLPEPKDRRCVWDLENEG